MESAAHDDEPKAHNGDGLHAVRPETVAGTPSVVVVLGMHRSGTSALTRVLNLLGVELGAELLPPNPDNLTGFWEHTEIYETQDRLLEALGSAWDDVRPLPAGWLSTPAARDAKDRLTAIVARDFASSRLWGFKDPRTCRLVPLWREILAERGLEPGFVLMVRNPLDVAGSLRARDGFPLAKSYLVWLRHLAASERDTRGLRRVIVGYDALLADWQGLAEHVGSGLGIHWPMPTDTVAAEVALFLQRALRHQDVGDAVLRDDRVLRLIEPCFRAAVAAMGGDDAPLQRALAAAEAEIATMERLFGPIVDDAEARRRRAEREAARVQAEAATTHEALRAAEGALAAERARAETLVREAEAARASLDVYEQRVGNLAEQAERLRGELARSEQARRDEAARLQQGIAARDHRVLSLEAGVMALSAVAQRSATSQTAQSKKSLVDVLPWQIRDRLRIARRRGLAKKLRESGLFDVEHYLRRHPEVREQRIDPVLHYLLWGAAWRYEPHPLFDTGYYLDGNPDIDPDATNPLLHYLHHGAHERRKPHPLFDTAYYLERYPDVATSGQNPLAHYLQSGGREGRQPHALFDSAYYLQQRPDVAAVGVNPLVHFVLAGAREGTSPHRLFDPRFYLAHNPDVARTSVNPLRHYLEFGAAESRDPHPLLAGATCTAAAPEALADGEAPLERLLRVGLGSGSSGIPVARVLKLLGPHVRDPGRSGCDAYLAPAPPARSYAGMCVALYASRRGNYFYDEMRALLNAALRAEGVDTILLDEESERPARVTHDVVVAPHEFFHLGEGRRWLDHPMLERAALITGEQLQTQWFVGSLPVLLRARTVLDINFHTAAVLRELVQLDAHFLPLGYLPGFTAFDPAPRLPDLPALRSLPASVRAWDPSAHTTIAERPLDVIFLGSVSPRRARLFARMARGLSEFHAFLHLYSLAGPLVQGSTAELTTEAVSGLAQRAKVMLNVHRDDVPYFEWQRVVLQAMWHGTVVATERSLGVPGFTAGEHYLEADAVDLPEVVTWLVRSSDGRRRAEEISVAARETLQTRFDLCHVVRCLLGRVLV